MRKRLVATVFLLGVLSGWGRAQHVDNAKHPNIFLITLDTLRTDHLGCYGYFRSTSPNIDEFSRQACLFTNVYAPMSTTLPSHLSMFTSTYPLEHGILANMDTLSTPFVSSDRLRLLSEFIREDGYETAAFVSATPVKRFSGINAGFDLFDEPDGTERNAEVTTNKVLAWLKGRSREKPFFLWVHYFDPHESYDPPAPYRELFKTDSKLIRFSAVRNRDGKPTTPKFLNFINLYDGEIRFLDESLGTLFRQIRSLEYWDNSIIILVSDHGEGLGQHDFLTHGPINQEQIQVPLIIKFGKRTSAPKRVNKLASVIDIFPTVLGKLQSPVAEGFYRQARGKNLLAGDFQRKHLFVQQQVKPRPGWNLTPGTSQTGITYAIITDRWKYFHLTRKEDRLYDIKKDPFELNCVLENNPKAAKELLKELKRKILDLQSVQVPRAKVKRKDKEKEKILKELKSLGYIQ